MKIVLAGIVLLAAAAYADVCVSPKLFAGTFETIVYSVDEDKLLTMTGGKLYYDEDNTQLRVDGQHEDNKYTVYMKYSEKKQYVVSAGHCFPSDLKDEFHSFVLPKDAKQVVKGSIGSNGESVDIVRYVGKEKGASFVATYTAKDCMLTSSTAYAKHDNGRYIAYVSVTDVDLSIDESPFELPSICHGAPSRRRRSVEGILENIKHLKL